MKWMKNMHYSEYCAYNYFLGFFESSSKSWGNKYSTETKSRYWKIQVKYFLDYSIVFV